MSAVTTALVLAWDTQVFGYLSLPWSVAEICGGFLFGFISANGVRQYF